MAHSAVCPQCLCGFFVDDPADFVCARCQDGQGQLDAHILERVTAEALRAHQKHGVNSLLSPTMPTQSKLAALVEEVGEVGRALTYDQDQDLVSELVQVGSVALSWAQSVLEERAWAQ